MRRLILLAAMVVAGACGGSDRSTGPSGADTPFVGTFTLRTVNGSGLPFVLLQSGTGSVSLSSDGITITDGGSWSESGIAKTTTNGVTTNQAYVDSGTWLRSGNSLLLHSNIFNNTAYGGTFTSSQLSFSDGTFAYVFTK